MPLDLLIIYGSVRRHRQGIKAARFILEECRGRGHQATLVDPAEEQLPLLDRMYKEYPPGQRPEVLERLAGRIKAADAFIIVSGEYNHSIPPALSNLLDHFLEEYFWRPSAIVCYSAGALRRRAGRDAVAGDALRARDAEHPVAPAGAERAGRLRRRRPAARRGYHRRAARFLDELEWYANALKAARQAACLIDWHHSAVPFVFAFRCPSNQSAMVACPCASPPAMPSPFLTTSLASTPAALSLSTMISACWIGTRISRVAVDDQRGRVVGRDVSDRADLPPDLDDLADVGDRHERLRRRVELVEVERRPGSPSGRRSPARSRPACRS